MDKPQNSLESIITNPGFQHISERILSHLDKKASLSLRLVNNACKNFVENPRHWLKLNYKKTESVELYDAWSKLIEKVEEENPDLEQNIVFNLSRLVNNHQWERKLSPLQVISLSGDTPLVKFIIEKNIVECLSRSCKDGWTPIHCATVDGHTETVKALIDSTDYPNAPDRNGWTPIHLAAKYGYIEIIQSLIGCTNNPNIPDNDGETPIHWAAAYGKTEIVKILLEYTDNPNAPANKGRTPIYHAAEFGYTEIVKILIECTDDPNAPDDYGDTPYEMAQSNDRLEIIDILKPYQDC